MANGARREASAERGTSRGDTGHGQIRPEGWTKGVRDEKFGDVTTEFLHVRSCEPIHRTVTPRRPGRDTRTRVSTEHIGLARLSEGLELVRIGAPQRPEFAAWRYGDQFGRRLKRTIIRGVGVTAVVGAVGAGLTAAGLVSGFMIVQGPNLLNIVWSARTRLKPRMKLLTDEGETIKVTTDQLEGVRVIPF